MNLYQKMNKWMMPKPQPRLRVVAETGTGKTYTPPLPLVAELAHLIDETTQDDIDRAERTADKVSREDKVLGTVHTHETKRMLALSIKLHGKRDACLHRARFEAKDEFLESELKQEAERWYDMGRVCVGMFWIQAKDDIGEPAWSADSQGLKLELRSGWVVVVAKPEPSAFEAIRARFETGT